MARYSIADTTLTALGDAVRTLTNKWGTYDSEEPITNSFNMTDFYTTITTDPDVFEPIVEVIRFPGAKNVKVEFNYSTNSSQWGFWIAPGEHTEMPAGARKYVGMWLPDKTYNTNKEIVFEDTDVISFGTWAWSYHDNVQHMANYLGYYVQSHGQFPYTFTPAEMAEKIEEAASATNTIPESALTITGDCQYKFAQGGWDWFLNQMGDKITTKDISNAANMFSFSKVSEILFDINLTVITNTYTRHSLQRMFSYADKLQAIPMIYNAMPSDLNNIFQNCKSLTTFPEGFAEDWNWSYFDGSTSAYNGSMANMFDNCMKLRKIPKIFFLHGNPYWTYNYNITNTGFSFCYSLEELEDVFIPYKGSLSGSYSNAFTNTVRECWRLKKFTLMIQEDGTPYTVNWKDQVIDLTTAGFCSNTNTMTRNTDFTNDTKIDTVEKWHGYIDGSYPDGWAASVEYSTFGATAVKELIATLPTASGTNTVKLKQAAASAIPGEEMTSLTEEDIAVAAAKGWTITFA